MGSRNKLQWCSMVLIAQIYKIIPPSTQAALETSTAKVAELAAQLQAATATAEDVRALRQRAQLVEEELSDANTKLEVQHKVGGCGVVYCDP